MSSLRQLRDEPTPRGWPRPWGTGHGAGRATRLPIPWIADAIRHRTGWDGEPLLPEDEKLEVAWTAFHGRATDAHTDRLCQICGDPLNGRIVLGRQGERATSGPGMHPRCAALAVTFCPHFRPGEGAYVAYLYEGPGRGYLTDPGEPPNEAYTQPNPVSLKATPMTRAEVKSLARTDPLGEENRL